MVDKFYQITTKVLQEFSKKNCNLITPLLVVSVQVSESAAEAFSAFPTCSDFAGPVFLCSAAPLFFLFSLNCRTVDRGELEA
jgi:hypothetical protein